MWRQGYPVSPQWEGSDFDSVNGEVGSFAARDHATESGPKGLHLCCEGKLTMDLDS